MMWQSSRRSSLAWLRALSRLRRNLRRHRRRRMHGLTHLASHGLHPCPHRMVRATWLHTVRAFHGPSSVHPSLDETKSSEDEEEEHAEEDEEKEEEDEEGEEKEDGGVFVFRRRPLCGPPVQLPSCRPGSWPTSSPLGMPLRARRRSSSFPCPTSTPPPASPPIG